MNKFSIAVKLDLLLICFWAVCFVICFYTHINLTLPICVVGAVISVIVVHAFISFYVLKPLARFNEIADQVVDGDISSSLKDLKLSRLKSIQGGFEKLIGGLIESREAIEDYMQTISDMNHTLEQKVADLSALFHTSQIMSSSLNPDTLARNFISVFIDRLGFESAGLMLYNPKTDTVSVKDIMGFSSELFARFSFYSNHRILNLVLSKNEYWLLNEQDKNDLVKEFNCDGLNKLDMIFSIRIKDHLVGLLLLGKGAHTDIDENSRLLAKSLATLASTSINNAILFETSEQTKNDLDHKVFNLMTLQQSAKILSSTLNLDELIRISIDMFLETVWANKGILMLFEDDRPELVVKASKGITPEEAEELKKNPAEAWVMATIEKEKKPIFAKDFSSGTSFQTYSVANKNLPFAAYIPMIKEGDLYGVIKVGAKINGEPFCEDDLEFFNTLSSQAVISFENARLYSLATTDSITKLYLHRYFQMRLEEEVARSKRYNETISLLMCDIDHFKPVNDTYGHQQGDIILKEVGRLLRKNLRTTDIPARYGGEEFAVILPETTQADAKIVAERIRKDIAQYGFPSLVPGRPPIKCSISIGVAGFPLNADTKDQLIQKADSALYKAKNSGRNKVVLCGID